MASWLLDGAQKDAQSVTADWEPAGQRRIDGCEVKSIRNVTKAGGVVTELFRTDWFEPVPVVDQVFQTLLEPGAIAAWHAHAETTDRLFVHLGQLRVVLFDAREGSPTQGEVNRFQLSLYTPLLVTIPPRVWHGVQNIGGQDAALMNMPDRAYRYEDPDHWRLPVENDVIPYRFEASAQKGAV